MAALRLLELGSNELRSAAGLREFDASLGGLEELHLGRNKLTSLEGLQGLRSLRVLGLASNRLKSLDGVQPLLALRELYADHNWIGGSAPRRFHLQEIPTDTARRNGGAQRRGA